MKASYTLLGILLVLPLLGCSTTKKTPTQDLLANRPNLDANHGAELSPEKSAELCSVTAQLLEQDGHLNEALLLYRKSQLQDQKNALYPHRIAVLYSQLGRNDLAEENFRQSIALDSENPQLLNDFGYFLYRKGQLAESEKFLRAAVASNPEGMQEKNNLALVLAHQEKYDEAFAMFSQTCGEAAAHSNIGLILAQKGRLPEARAALNDAISQSPSMAQAHAALQHLDSIDDGSITMQASHTNSVLR